MEILAAFVAGLLALIGGYVGAWTARRTEYERWLRQERGAVFSEFLRQLHATWVNCIGWINDTTLTDSETELRIAEQFAALESQQNIVRLYLFKGDREAFTELIRRLWAAQSRALGQSRRMEATRELVKAIQFTLESRLHG